MSPLVIPVDVETYSEAGYLWSDVKSYTTGGKEKPGWLALKKGQKSGLHAVGGWCYAEHPTTELLSMDYGGAFWVPGMAAPLDLFEHIANGGLIEAHNSLFEWMIWLHVCHRRMGWPDLPLSQMRCTMARCNAHGLPGALDKVCTILQLDVVKDMAGSAVMKKLSKPRDPTQKDARRRYTPADEPEMFQHLYRYNKDDTAAQTCLSARVPHLSAFELAVWQLDQRINARGVACDIDAIRGGRKILAALEAEKLAELHIVTKGMVETGSQVDRIKQFCNLHGVHLPDLQKDTVTEFLLRSDVQGAPRKVLELRQFLSLASVKKLAAMENRYANDGHLHDMFKYSGAIRTQRWSSEAAQLHNLAKKGPSVKACDSCDRISYHKPKTEIPAECQFCGDLFSTSLAQWNVEAVEQCLADIRAGDLHQLRARWGDDAALAISGCLRGMLTAGPGNDLIGTDYDQIEARILAILAGEEWRIEVFKQGGSTYETTAAGISGMPLAEILAYKERTGQDHPYRDDYGKVPDLACGFQGAFGAFLRFGADAFMSDDEIYAAVKTWRAANPMIVKLWYAAEDCVVRAIVNPGNWQRYRLIAYLYEPVNDVLYCCLPSGRYLSYHTPRLTPNDWGKYNITYMSQHQTSGAWIRIDGYGGMFVENFTQAIARDYMAWGMLQLDAAGFDIALHVHDEPVVEVLAGTRSIEEVEACLAIKPPWAQDWPITASGGWRGKRFRKD